MFLVGRATDPSLPAVIDVADLKNIPLILPGRTEALRILCETAAAQSGFVLKVVVEADTFTAIRQLIDGGYGYSILPFPAVQLEVKQGLYQVSRLVNPPVTRQLVVTTCGDRIPAAPLASLVRLIKSVVIEAVEPRGPPAPGLKAKSVVPDHPRQGRSSVKKSTEKALEPF